VTGASAPKIEEVQPLDFHQPDIDQKVVTAHACKRNDEPDNGFGCNKFSLFFYDIIHISFNSPKDEIKTLSNKLAPNGCKPIKEPKTKNHGSNINQGSSLFLNLF
jgi:hypothetical protein